MSERGELVVVSAAVRSVVGAVVGVEVTCAEIEETLRGRARLPDTAEIAGLVAESAVFEDEFVALRELLDSRCSGKRAFLGQLRALGACYSAYRWVVSRRDVLSLEDAWRECSRADWLAWLAARVDAGLKTLCAALLPRRQPAWDGRVSCVYDALSDWIDGGAPPNLSEVEDLEEHFTSRCTSLREGQVLCVARAARYYADNGGESGVAVANEVSYAQSLSADVSADRVRVCVTADAVRDRLGAWAAAHVRRSDR